LDLILCRNVLIYFEPQIVCAVQTRLFAALAPGGWLVLGASDPPMPPIDACEKVVTEAGIFYRRGGRTISTCAIAVKPAESAAAPHGRGSPPIGQPNPDAPVSDRATPSAFALGDAAVPRQQEGAGLSSSAEKPGAEPDAWAALVGELANRGDAIAAEHTALEGIGRYPLVPELHHLRALLLLGLGRLDEAAEAARRLLYLDRKLAFGHLTLAVILQRMGKADEAARAFRNAESLLAAQRPDSVVPLAEGRCAGLLAETVRGQLSILCGSGEPTV
jgi:chemotaxis protein methyltransferase CheR